MCWAFMWKHSSEYWTTIHVKKFLCHFKSILEIEVENKMDA